MSYRIMKIPACLFEPMIENGVHVMTDAVDPIEDPKIFDVTAEWEPMAQSPTIIVLVHSPSFPGPERKPNETVRACWDIASEYEEFNPSFRTVARREWVTEAERSE